MVWTVNVWLPWPSALYDCGEVHAANAPASSLHCGEPSLTVKPNIALVLLDGFDGVLFSDDLSAAVAVSAWSPAERAVDAISAGVDVVLVSAKPSVFPAMYDAVLAKAKSDPQFAAQVDAAAARVPADWLLPTTNPSSLPPIEQLPAIPEELRERIVALRAHILALQAELTSALRTWQHSQRATLGTGLVGTAAQPPVYVDRHL